jgi:hypothetical protein
VTFFSASISARETFPSQLLRLVSDPNQRGIIEWSPDGTWIEFDEDKLQPVLSSYFSTQNHQSFVRQLNNYGFISCQPSSTNNKKLRAYSHPCFLRNRSDLLPQITRRKGKSRSKSTNVDRISELSRQLKETRQILADFARELPKSLVFACFVANI